jgi:hypothetical protein
MREQLSSAPAGSCALSSLASGSDQLFAQIALELQFAVTAVIPMQGYERLFKGAALVEYRRLLSRCTICELASDGSPQENFFAAGKYIVDHSDIIIAVWDGQPSRGLGGTADVVSYAHSRGRSLVHIDPVAMRVTSPRDS